VLAPNLEKPRQQNLENVKNLKGASLAKLRKISPGIVRMSRVLKYLPQRVKPKRVNPEKIKRPRRIMKRKLRTRKITMSEEREKEKVPNL